MPRTRWLTAEEQQLWRLFARVLIQVPEEIEGQLRQEQLTHFGYWVLSALSETPHHRMRMHELAAMAQGSPSRLSHVVSGLERRGLIRRERAKDDGRGNVAVLTEAGYHKVLAVAPGHVDTVRATVFDALDEAQLHQLDGICRALIAHLDTAQSNGEDRGSP